MFQCTSAEKAHTLALAIAKAFYLAYQIIQEQQGKFPAPPERELLFEPQRPDDTTSHPKRPIIQGSEDPFDTTHPDQVMAEVSKLLSDDLYLILNRNVYLVHYVFYPLSGYFDGVTRWRSCCCT